MSRESKLAVLSRRATMNIDKLIKYDPDLISAAVQKIIIEHDDGTKEGWSPGEFWNKIKLNFVEGIDPSKIKTKLTDAQKQRLRNAIGDAIDQRVSAYLGNSQSVVSN